MSSYDQNLLDEAPRATRAQLQEGYNVDLLEQPPRRTPSTRIPPPQTPQPAPVTVPLMSGIADGSGEKFGSSTHASAAPRPRTSFWRSRNGVIAVVIIVLIVIGAVVGGAVGGTVKKSSNNAVATGATISASSPTSSIQPVITPVSNTTSTALGTVGSQGIATGGGASRPVGFTAAATTTSTTLTAGGQNVGRATG